MPSVNNKFQQSHCVDVPLSTNQPVILRYVSLVSIKIVVSLRNNVAFISFGRLFVSKCIQVTVKTYYSRPSCVSGTQ